MDRHVDLLALLFIVSAAMAGVAGLALLPLAGSSAWLGATGEAPALPARVATVLFAGLGIVLLVFAAINLTVGRGLRRRVSWARMAGLALALVDLFVPPFGTALGAYALWVLLRQDTRDRFASAVPGRS